MGWSHCGEDDSGRPIGYAHEATCDEEGCGTRIDRGLSYVCGTMHGGTPVDDHESTVFFTTCGRYFCSDHRVMIVGFVDGNDRGIEVCATCARRIRETIGNYNNWPKSYETPPKNDQVAP